MCLCLLCVVDVCTTDEKEYEDVPKTCSQAQPQKTVYNTAVLVCFLNLREDRLILKELQLENLTFQNISFRKFCGLIFLAYNRCGSLKYNKGASTLRKMLLPCKIK